jgi:hypothetical protein
MMTDLDDEGHDVRRRLERVVARPALLSPEIAKPDLPVSAQPEIELAARDPAKAACLTDVPGDLFVVMDPSQTDLRSAKRVLLPLRLSHAGPPR